jgi:hypothetical protein
MGLHPSLIKIKIKYMAYRINLTSDSQRITAATIDSSCTPRDRSLHKYTGVTTNNAWQNIVNGDSTPGDTALVLVINANTSSSSRQGYGEIMYNIDGTECSTILHLVQAGSGGEVESHRIYIDVSTLVSGLSNYKLYFTDVAPNVSLHAVSLLKEDGSPFATSSDVSGGKVNLALLKVEKNGSNCTYLSDEMSHGEIWFNIWSGTEYSHGDIPHNTSIYVVLVPNNYDEKTNPGFRLCTAVTLNENNVTCGDYTITVDSCAY